MELWERSGRNGVELKGGQSTSSVEWGSPRKRLGEMGGHIDVVKSVDMSPKWFVLTFFYIALEIPDGDSYNISRLMLGRLKLNSRI